MKKSMKWMMVMAMGMAMVACNEQELTVDECANEEVGYHWALTGNVYAHDPCIVKEGNLWWSFQTGAGIGVKYSTDGLNWTQGVQVFGSELSWWRTYAPAMGANDVWAPDIFYYNGRYWLYYSVSEFGKNNSAIGLTSCSSIVKGDWRDDGLVVKTKYGTNATNAIDPNITQDASGNLWMSYGSWFDGIKVVKLSKSTMKPTGTHYAIARRSAGIEASDIVYNGGYYYLFVSFDKCCSGVNSTYKVAVGRATSITGPYVDKNGVNMLNGGGTYFDTGNSRWVGPGGQDIYKNGSRFVMIRHAYDAAENGAPKMLISDLYFSNGWPTY
ncbi:arabinan endo-1,5-alpha-L-arabinosidase [Breznakibacter xylanolyticus]|uniref:Arabinan endo-1,5-alpha-L-arabinosidase n=1 Tax=Breznakibacter xylanolyticus TaxID=990 RepID=A0A2W7NKP9_9BACT|nr:glycoside hydrolase family 43 protein [Breznakibacter xylanolyticus]PZX18667.1 arabinan endo-1,5-alpha-L-arabinosidase [Breznakibacter xylanolyticus]